MGPFGQSDCDPDTLRRLFLFEDLSEEQLATLCRHATVDEYEAGPLFFEGQPATSFFVLIDGELLVSKRAGGRDVEAIRTSYRGSYCGAVAAFLDEPPERYDFSVRTCRRTRLVTIDAVEFGRFVRAEFPMAVHMLQGMFVDWEAAHRLFNQEDRIQAAGTVSAGLMHGLNNPVGAIKRIAGELRMRTLDGRQGQGPQGVSSATSAVYDELRREALAAAAGYAGADTALDLADREDEVADWLSARSFDEPWDTASTLVAAGFDATFLDGVAGRFTAAGASGDLAGAIRGLADGIEMQQLIDELAEASARVSALVAAAQQYSQLDSSPFVVTDIHQLLDSTLTVMADWLDENVTVVRRYDDRVPPVSCYAGQLNQAWTNIVTNAVDALRRVPPQNRTLLVCTSLTDSATVQVEIADSGPGIPDGIREQIFVPFYTTKAVNEGIGTGLDLARRVIVDNHGGTLKVESDGRGTRLIARLPVNGPDRSV
jgi:signal transduction histidine kinase